MPVDVVRRVSDTLARADALFGSASADAVLPAQLLTDAADALRSTAALDMSGLAATGYGAFAVERASTLARLADTDAAVNHIIDTAASAENTAAAASRSTVTAAAEYVDNLPPVAQSPGGQRALIAALQLQVGHLQDLVRRHQHQAAELAEQLRGLSYD